MSEQHPPVGGTRTDRPAPLIPPQPPITPTPEQRQRAKIGDIGPAWITAISGLIVALTGAGFFVGRAATPEVHAPSSPTASVMASAVQTLSQTSPSAGSTPPTGVPETPAGTVLAENCAITLAKDYNLAVGANPGCPFPTKDDVIGISWWYAYSITPKGNNITLAKLENSPASYEACKQNTRYTTGVTYPAVGDVICFVGNGVVAAVTFTKNSQSSGFAEFNLTTWRR